MALRRTPKRPPSETCAPGGNRVRIPAFIAVCFLSGWASAATVHLTQPIQGQTVTDGNVIVVARVTDDFIIGKSGFIELWVDGHRSMALPAKNATLKLSPGSHQLQARLVGVDQKALAIPTDSEVV